MTRIALILSLLAAGPAAAAGERHALLVAVKQYDRTQLTNLDHTENDVAVLAEVLRQGGYKRVVLLTQSQGSFDARFLPTSANIRRELRSLIEGRQADDTIVIAFCGHGVQLAGVDEPWFCPMDASLKDRKTLISLSEVYEAMGRSKARAKVLFSDSCRNDPLPAGPRPAELKNVTAPKGGGRRDKAPENVAALFSCSAGEVAYESEKLRHGVFFHFLIQGLRGKAAPPGKEVTLNSLTDYVQRAVPEHVKEAVGPKAMQRPELVSRANFPITLLPAGRAVAKASPKEVKELTDRALDHLKSGEYRQAAEAATRALGSSPDSALLLAVRGHALEQLREPKRALADANKALEIDPGLASAYHTRGNVFLFADNQPRKALAEYDEAIKRSPRHLMAHVNRGRAYLALGQVARAEEDFTQAVRIDPKCASAYQGRARAAMRKGDNEGALADLARALEANPRMGTAYQDRATVYTRLKKDDEALRDLDQAVRLLPRSAQAVNARGNLYLERNDLDRAMADYSEAIRLDPRFAAALFNRGLAFFKRKDYRTAIADFDEAIKLDGKNARYWHMRGAARSWLKEWDKAVADYTRAVELDPTRAGAYADRAKAHRARGDKARAEADDARAKKLSQGK
jgi:tetratricopeptide (TPR) repeat protein